MLWFLKGELKLPCERHPPDGRRKSVVLGGGGGGDGGGGEQGGVVDLGLLELGLYSRLTSSSQGLGLQVWATLSGLEHTIPVSKDRKWRQVMCKQASLTHLCLSTYDIHHPTLVLPPLPCDVYYLPVCSRSSTYCAHL